MKNCKLHRYPNAIRKPEIKKKFIFHKVTASADSLVLVKYLVKYIIYCTKLDFLLESKLTYFE